MADGVYTKTNKDLNAWLTDAKSFCDNFEMLPDDFPVHSDYLIDGGWYTDDDDSQIADLARSLGVNLKFTSYIRYCVKP